MIIAFTQALCKNVCRSLMVHGSDLGIGHSRALASRITLARGDSDCRMHVGSVVFNGKCTSL